MQTVSAGVDTQLREEVAQLKATVAQLREEMEERLVPLEVREQSLQYGDQDRYDPEVAVA